MSSILQGPCSRLWSPVVLALNAGSATYLQVRLNKLLNFSEPQFPCVGYSSGYNRAGVGIH